MASTLVAMANTLVAIASNLVAMASNLIAMASTLVAMASNLIAMDTLPGNDLKKAMGDAKWRAPSRGLASEHEQSAKAHQAVRPQCPGSAYEIFAC